MDDRGTFDSNDNKLVKACEEEIKLMSNDIYRILENASINLLNNYGDVLRKQVTERVIKEGCNVDTKELEELFVKKTAIMSLLHGVVIKTVSSHCGDNPARSLSIFGTLFESVLSELTNALLRYVASIHHMKVQEVLARIDPFTQKMEVDEKDDGESKTIN